MQLTRLEIKGFKSFADKVTINFDEGITGIVGPNDYRHFHYRYSFILRLDSGA